MSCSSAERCLHRDAEHRGVAGNAPGPSPSMKRPAKQLIEKEDAIGHEQRVVIRQRKDAGAQFDVTGLWCCERDEDHRVGNDLGAGRVVLANPGFFVSEPVKELNNLRSRWIAEIGSCLAGG